MRALACAAISGKFTVLDKRVRPGKEVCRRCRVVSDDADRRDQGHGNHREHRPNLDAVRASEHAGRARCKVGEQYRHVPGATWQIGASMR